MTAFLDKAKQALYDHVFRTLKKIGIAAKADESITVTMLRAVANEERPGLPELQVQWLFNYYIYYGEAKRAWFQKQPKLALKNAFAQAEPYWHIEDVFDVALGLAAAQGCPKLDAEVPAEVCATVHRAKPAFSAPIPIPAKLLPPFCKIQPVDAYEAMRTKFGWDSEAKIKIENALQASQTKPSEHFIDWLEGAIKRYFEEFNKIEAEPYDGLDAVETFLDKFFRSSEVWSSEHGDETPKTNINESVNVVCAHVPIHTCTRFVETPYDPSIQFDIDLHMRTSFTNRLKAVDWTYHLQLD
jgi:hypothetical protein